MLAAFVLAASVSTIGNMPVVFPCKPFRTLTYKAIGQWEQGAGPDTIIKKTLNWYSTYLRCSYSATKAVAVVLGLPGDLSWYTPGIGPQFYTIIQTAKGLYLQQGALDPKTNLEEIQPSTHDLYLSFPVTANTCANKKDQRVDDDYCWFVDSITHQAGKPIWTITYRSLPDYTRIRIEPGVGITSYVYHHNGTVAEVSARLMNKQ